MARELTFETPFAISLTVQNGPFWYWRHLIDGEGSLCQLNGEGSLNEMAKGVSVN